MGTVKELRCESIYHAVTSCMGPDSEPVLSIVHPRSTYVSIGCSQELEKEVDLTYCEDHQYDVFRRDVEGGAFLWNNDQLIFHLMWPSASSDLLGLPISLQDRFAVLSKPAILAYQNSGIPATFQPPNDIYVRGKKIGGMITGEIEKGAVVAVSMMFDFDAHTMSQVLRVPPENGPIHGANSSSHSEMTSMRQELGSLPKYEVISGDDPLLRGEVAEALLVAFVFTGSVSSRTHSIYAHNARNGCDLSLGRATCEPGVASPREKRERERVEEALAKKPWELVETEED